MPEPEVRVRDKKGQRFEQIVKVVEFYGSILPGRQ